MNLFVEKFLQLRVRSFASPLLIVHWTGDNAGYYAVDAHAQDFFAKHKLLLPILKALTHYTCSLHATLNAWYFLRAVVESCDSYKLQFSNSPHNQETPAPRQTRSIPTGLNSFSVTLSRTTRSQTRIHAPRGLLPSDSTVHVYMSVHALNPATSMMAVKTGKFVVLLNVVFCVQ
jgi:hypothetical protein